MSDKHAIVKAVDVVWEGDGELAVEPAETYDGLPLGDKLRYHAAHVEVGKRYALLHALELGSLLNSERANKQKGTWEEWLKNEIPGLSVRSCQRYMKLADQHGKLLVELRRRALDVREVSLRKAFRLLADMAEKPPRPRRKPHKTTRVSETIASEAGVRVTVEWIDSDTPHFCFEGSNGTRFSRDELGTLSRLASRAATEYDGGREPSEPFAATEHEV